MSMTISFLLIAGVAWIGLTRWLDRRNERLRRGPWAWSQMDQDRTFHSTGWEVTLPPNEAATGLAQRQPSRGRRAHA